MVRSVYELRGYSICAQDGELGQVDQFLFDDVTGKIRYLVVRTGGWLFGSRVVIEPQVLGAINTHFQTLDIRLTRQQIQASPDLHDHPPVSQQSDDIQHTLDSPGWEITPGPWFRTLPQYRAQLAADRMRARQQMIRPPGDAHLRSTREVIGYRLKARDGALGHVADFIVDDTTWSTRFIVVDTGFLWSGKRVLLPWQRIERIDWAESTVEVDMLRATIKRHPPYDLTALQQRNRAQLNQIRS